MHTVQILFVLVQVKLLILWSKNEKSFWVCHLSYPIWKSWTSKIVFEKRFQTCHSKSETKLFSRNTCQNPKWKCFSKINQSEKWKRFQKCHSKSEKKTFFRNITQTLKWNYFSEMSVKSKNENVFQENFLQLRCIWFFHLVDAKLITFLTNDEIFKPQGFLGACPISVFWKIFSYEDVACARIYHLENEILLSDFSLNP